MVTRSLVTEEKGKLSWGSMEDLSRREDNSHKDYKAGGPCKGGFREGKGLL